MSAVNAVNLVNSVNAVKYAPPPGGVAKAKHEITCALIPSDDFGEITDTGLLANHGAFELDPRVGNLDQFAKFIDVSITISVEIDVGRNVQRQLHWFALRCNLGLQGTVAPRAWRC